MSDDAPAPEIQINVKGPSELKLQISITTDKSVLELKQAIAEKSDVGADRQRLIYSGRVLKDEDPLSTYKIQSSHTIHMVKGIARSSGGASNSSSPTSNSTPQPLPTMQTGQNPHDPLTQLNSHMGFGAMAGLNPFGDMGLNPNDPNMMQTMMNSPEFLQQMSTMLQNPAIVDQVIAMNPNMAGMGAHVRETLQSEQFRNMISNPEQLQQMMRMAQMFNGAGMGGGMGMFGAPSAPFPAPGTPNASSTTPSTTTSNTTSPTTTTSPAANPFGMFGGAGGAGGNPFAADPALMQQLLSGGGFGGGAGGFGGGYGAGGFGGGGAPAVPTDTRPPEERFQVQLQQLQDMGFTNAAQNVRALLATGGRVDSAIEYILGGGGL